MEYNLKIDYEFYVKISSGQKKQGKDSNRYQKRTATQKVNNKNKPPGGSVGGLPSRVRKKNYWLNLPTLNRPIRSFFVPGGIICFFM